MDSMLYHNIFRNLPEEIVHEVLSQTLSIPDEDFCSTTNKSPFAKVTFNDIPSKVILDVCKQWHRIGTPLLYETVIFRSKAQIQALWWTLTHHPGLRKYVKKLRIERWYSVVADVLKLTPNITDVWMNLKLYSSDVGKGLAKALLLIDPKRVILKDECLKSRARREFLDVVCDRLPSWKKLTCLHYSAVKRPNMYQVDKLTKTFPSCHHLRYIHFSALPEPPFEFLEALSKHKSLVSIFLRDQMQIEDLIKALEAKHPDVAKKLNSANERTKSVKEESTSSHKVKCVLKSQAKSRRNPLTRVDSPTRTVILTKILRHALNLPENDNWSTRCNSDWAQIPNFCSVLGSGAQHPVRYLLVSSEFWRIALPMLYEVVHLYSARQCQSLANTLRQSSFGRLIRVIVVSRWFGAQFYYDQYLHQICSQSPSLVSLVPLGAAGWDDDLRQVSSGGEPLRPWCGFTVQEFMQLAATAGATLQVLAFKLSDSCRPSPLPCSRVMLALWSFQHLRSLVWNCSLVLHPETLNGAIIYSDALPALERLVYRSKDDTFFRMLCPMELFALRTLELPIPGYMEGFEMFLNHHGLKLTSLTIAINTHVPGLLSSYCPNIRELTIPITGCSMSGWETNFNEVHHNVKLEKVVIMSVNNARVLKRATDFLPHLNLSRFYALEEFHLNNYKWPTEQHDIDRSAFVPIAEKFYSQWNVRTLDRDNKAWRPRLKARKAGWNPWKSLVV